MLVAGSRGPSAAIAARRLHEVRPPARADPVDGRRGHGRRRGGGGGAWGGGRAGRRAGALPGPRRGLPGGAVRDAARGGQPLQPHARARALGGGPRGEPQRPRLPPAPAVPPQRDRPPGEDAPGTGAATPPPRTFPSRPERGLPLSEYLHACSR